MSLSNVSRSCIPSLRTSVGIGIASHGSQLNLVTTVHSLSFLLDLVMTSYVCCWHQLLLRAYYYDVHTM